MLGERVARGFEGRGEERVGMRLEERDRVLGRRLREERDAEGRLLPGPSLKRRTWRGKARSRLTDIGGTNW
jgi:hypothetical protein